MSSDFVLSLGQNAIWTMLKICAPLLGVGLLVGLIVSVFQATTQIQEQSLQFIPKLIAVFAAMLIFGPWMLSLTLDFTRGILGNLSSFIR
ncbi:flagellar biosynthesis protein FliQ [Tumebacillus sp. ITR2]|uniref:Flagellar biosynthetic protein FliQ n=2 Tax=Tumebacillus TaxID=432330 RepID=A0A074LR20_9BACL|nr:flagellar biosynthesis protein FliQ [Tumebacillus flagellatus]KEO82945.1 flagellar biosynthesis protein FliQ [Tumebacillus flagellatus]MBL0388925.1 flagellar biosynthesis protein FliQ [Tumebacillus amylolyticus]